MSNVNLFRGATPDFKAFYCNGEYGQFRPPFSATHAAQTPPFDSHFCGAWGLGYFTPGFPLVPNLGNTRAHQWMKNALADVKAVGDKIRLIWVPLRSYVTSVYFEVTETDKALDGVVVSLFADRVKYNAATDDFVYTTDTGVAADLAGANFPTFTLGTTGVYAKYGIARLPESKIVFTTVMVDGGSGNTPDTQVIQTVSGPVSRVPSTFGVNIPGDTYEGGVVFGIQITAASNPANIANLQEFNGAAYLSLKLESFESPAQL
jgi:hypothetical protein